MLPLVACVAACVVVPATPAPAADAVNWQAAIGLTLPSDAATTGQSSDLFSVSCVDAGDCVAAGNYFSDEDPPTDHFRALLFSQTAGSWGIGLAAPLPSNALTTGAPASGMDAVDCTAIGRCDGVGHYDGGGGSYLQGMLLDESGGAWSSAQLVLPSDAATNPSVEFFGTSCTSPGNCVAVGSYSDKSNYRQGLVVTETAGPGVRV